MVGDIRLDRRGHLKGCIGLRSRGCLLECNPNDSLCSSFYSGIEEVVEDGGGGISRTKGWHGGGFISSFGCTKSFDEDTECMQ